MPANTEHPVFKQPSSFDIKFWRYMDFTKYVSMLDSNSLYFSRADLLGDSFEGSSSRANLELRPQVYKEMIEEMSKANPVNQDAGTGWLDEWSRIIESGRQWLFVNSWHMNEYESAAMWRLYAKTDEAIAVQSTYARLRDCLPSEIDVGRQDPSEAYIGEVQYIDYDTDWLPEGNTFYPIVHKRKSFEHEREFRAVIYDGSGRGDRFSKNQRKGLLIEVSLDDLIEAVYVAPTAPSWFRDLVEAVTGKYGFAHKPVIRSSLGQDPVY